MMLSCTEEANYIVDVNIYDSLDPSLFSFLQRATIVKNFCVKKIA